MHIDTVEVCFVNANEVLSFYIFIAIYILTVQFVGGRVVCPAETSDD